MDQEWQKKAKEASQDYKELLSECVAQMKGMNIDRLMGELADINHGMQLPEFWDDSDKATELSQKKSALEKRVQPWLDLETKIKDNLALIEMSVEENDSDSLQMCLDEYQEQYDLFKQLEIYGVLNKPEDAYDCYVHIQPGAGGTESQDWAEMLFRMYKRWFERKQWKFEILDYQAGDQAGIKNAQILVHGENAFGMLKSENGVHRLVRISPFDSNAKRHTSFASIHVSPDLPEGETVEINETELRIDTYRSSGAGGQHVNTTDSAVRITHLPTGVTVQCQNERSQMKNRATAMKMLQARLVALDEERKREEAEATSGEKREIGWGSQIRSYVFHPYNMVKDHRTSEETSNIQAVMDGDLDRFIMSFLKHLMQKQSRNES